MLIAFSGTHGTGKSTAVFEKAHRLKMDYPNKTINTITENAKHSPYKINKETSLKSQLWIYTDGIQKELYMNANYDIVVCDRAACVDAISYTYCAGLTDLAESMYQLSKHHIGLYDHIYLKTISNNDYLFHDNNRDANDKIFRQNVEDNLRDLYIRFIKEGYLKLENYTVI